ncbi:MAG: phage portal protein [Pseudomonadota bacterium]
MIAEAAASVPLMAVEDGRRLSVHPLLDLVERPNPEQTRSELFEAFYGHLQTAGNAYMEAASIGGAVRELFVLRPDRMHVRLSDTGWPAAYDYTVGGRTVSFPVSRDAAPTILHMRLFNPTDDHYGLSPLEAAAVAIDVHNATQSWNKALLDNAARPSGALVHSGGEGARELTDAQFDRLKAELEGAYAGADNAGRPLVLDGGLDWRQMALSPTDMDFISAKNSAARTSSASHCSTSTTASSRSVGVAAGIA